MIYDPATAHFLKPWLVRTLEPVCDAEPGALADYILALLKHNVSEPEMRKELLIQLDEFLEKECPPFVDTLFTVLRTKSYLPYTSEPAPPRAVDSGIPIPLDLITPSPSDSNMERGRKRSLEADDRDGRPPAKGARVSSEEEFSRYGNGSGRSSGQWEGRGGDGRRGDYVNGRMDAYHVPMMGGMGQMNGVRRPHSYYPPEQKRGICRDYYNNGYCARGVMCKYSHGDDAMVPGQLYMPPGLPFMFPGAMPFGPGVGYDPNDSQMDMRPRNQRTPMLPRLQQEEGGMVHASGELPVIQDLTPSIPKDSTDGPSQIQDTQRMQETEGSAEAPSQSQMDVSQPLPAPYISTQSHADMGAGVSHRGGYRGRGRGRGTFGGEVHSFRPERRGDKTLVVEKIPEDKLSLANVNDWFKRFGSVTNVAIDRMGGKALVSFSTHEEAYAAWKSEDAVFNNRFVKVFWHRPMQGQGQIGARILAASAPVVAGIAAKTDITTAGATSSTASVPPRKSSSTPGSSAASALAAKQQLLEQQIAEQKSLMASLETATPEEKKDIMTRLRKLGEEMKTSISTPTTPQIAAPLNDQQQKERDKLDKELELHSTSTPESTPAEKPKQESTEELKAKLEKLKAEAASLGLSTEGSSYAGAPSYRGGYRGRARGGRGFFRGAPTRGAAPRFNMTLDNRPKKLLLKGAKDEHLQAVRDWYETTGQLDSVDVQEGEGVVVAFKTRTAAEQGFAKGSNIPIAGQVQINWFTGKTTPAVSTPNSTKLPEVTSTGENASTGGVYEKGRAPTPDAEEEMVARGWGGDDDGDGMGLL
ncbi:hypothetical protein AGABI2DRAFT_198413 [Agaricus bisporus var. bisporus H97]|uniref:hypothetical protein n=1 Tax=Agaricus bisporus var. bisporus (strain H97 / ATCC MYA-4626 / FGSC 10389) TaxID=936046 RepID=UPI00029F504D|nr:hypothetical protein AGABI2DRAFT_198413 [Agaricus bisporus var. bisporus H97]EKV51831.1 hypothetical protein AGABI2DRAFT_198413 [Agaricus bisporus var. bisporus H97]